MIITNTIKYAVKDKLKHILLLIGVVLVVFVLAVIAVQVSGTYYSKIYSKEETPIIRQVKTEVHTTGKDPCDILAEMLSGVQKDKKLKRDIVNAQKYFGCRNRQKRQVR